MKKNKKPTVKIVTKFFPGGGTEIDSVWIKPRNARKRQQELQSKQVSPLMLYLILTVPINDSEEL